MFEHIFDSPVEICFCVLYSNARRGFFVPVQAVLQYNRAMLSGFVRQARGFLHILLFSVSPMFILMFIVGVIVLLERGGAHYQFVRQLETEGLVAEAVVEGLSLENDWAMLRLAAPDGMGNPNRFGILELQYYPDLRQRLQNGDRIQVRYLPPSYESRTALESRLDEVRGYWGWALEAGVLMLISWLVVIFYPHWLYLGYGSSLDELMSRDFDKKLSGKAPEKATEKATEKAP